MLLHVFSNRKTSVPFYPKGMFKTSFGPSAEYLVIPANFPPASAKPARPLKDAPTILFLNGIMLHFSQWAMQLPAFTRTHSLPGFSNHNLILINNLGHGGSELGDATKENYLRRCAQAAAELLAHLGIQRVGIITQSMGTLVALEFLDIFGQQGGSIDRMAFVSPVLCKPMRVFPHESIIAPRVGAIRNALSDDEFVKRLEIFIKTATNPLAMAVWHRFYKTWTGSTIDFTTFRSTITKALSLDARSFITAYDAMDSEADRIGKLLEATTMPALAVLGKHDFVTDHVRTELLIKTLRPDMDILSLAGCAHWANSEMPHNVNPILTDFFR
jgi:pimeloyl-ACP methyl ester carboxylesterase